MTMTMSQRLLWLVAVAWQWQSTKGFVAQPTPASRSNNNDNNYMYAQSDLSATPGLFRSSKNDKNTTNDNAKTNAKKKSHPIPLTPLVSNRITRQNASSTSTTSSTATGELMLTASRMASRTATAKTTTKTPITIPGPLESMQLLQRNNSSRRKQRYPFPVLFVKALRVMDRVFSSRPRTSTTTTAEVPPPPQRSPLPGFVQRPQQQQQEFLDRILTEARLYLQLDAGVRAAVGTPLEQIIPNRNSNSNSNIKLATSRAASPIHYQNTKLWPLELGFQVKGPKASGVAIAMVTPEHGIIRLTLHSSNKCINVSLSTVKKKR